MTSINEIPSRASEPSQRSHGQTVNEEKDCRMCGRANIRPFAKDKCTLPSQYGQTQERKQRISQLHAIVSNSVGHTPPLTAAINRKPRHRCPGLAHRLRTSVTSKAATSLKPRSHLRGAGRHTSHLIVRRHQIAHRTRQQVSLHPPMSPLPARGDCIP